MLRSQDLYANGLKHTFPRYMAFGSKESTVTGLNPAITRSEVGCHIHSATEVGGAGPKVRKEN